MPLMKWVDFVCKCSPPITPNFGGRNHGLKKFACFQTSGAGWLVDQLAFPFAWPLSERTSISLCHVGLLWKSRPVHPNADMHASYEIDLICRLPLQFWLPGQWQFEIAVVLWHDLIEARLNGHRRQMHVSKVLLPPAPIREKITSTPTEIFVKNMLPPKCNCIILWFVNWWFYSNIVFVYFLSNTGRYHRYSVL